MNNESLESIQLLLETRIFAYDLLRRTFLEEPSKEFLGIITEEGFIESFPFIEENKEIREGVSKVATFLEGHDLTSEEDYDSLHWDYTRMFIGPDKLPAPLWESAYLNKDRLLFQEVTLNVRQAYLKYQFLPKYFRQEADDHLGLELDFMYQLSNQALECLKSQEYTRFSEVLRDQRDFLQEHLLKWVSDLADKILANAKLDFYPGMAEILKGYLALDFEALKELLDIEY